MSSPLNAPMDVGRSMRSLSTLYGASFALSFGHGMAIPTIPLMVGHFDISIFWGAQIITAWSIGALLGTPPAGMITDRFGARVPLLVGPTLIMTAGLAIVFAPWFWLVLVAMTLAGMGHSSWMIGREIAGVEMFAAHQRGRMMSGFMGTNASGMALGPALGGVLGDSIDFRAVFVGYALVAALVFVLSLRAPVKRRDPADRPQRAAAPRQPFWSAERFTAIPRLVREIEPRLRKTYLILVYATFNTKLHRTLLHSMLPLYVVIYRGFSASELGFLLGIQGVFVMVMILPGGLVSDKLGRKWATVPSTALPAISFVLIPFSDGYWEIATLLMFLGLSDGLALGSIATSTYDVIPAHARGRLQALRRSTSEAGSITGSLAGGRIASLANPGVPFLAAAPLLIVAALLIAFVAKETLVKPQGVVTSDAPPG
jgi:MFS family permease